VPAEQVLTATSEAAERAAAEALLVVNGFGLRIIAVCARGNGYDRTCAAICALALQCAMEPEGGRATCMAAAELATRLRERLQPLTRRYQQPFEPAWIDRILFDARPLVDLRTRWIGDLVDAMIKRLAAWDPAAALPR
jgi:hypothetical protein